MNQEGPLTKLRIKIGQVEVEYEGTDEFLKKELPELLKAVLELHGKAATKGSFESAEKSAAPVDVAPKGTPMSVSTVASALGGTSGGDLAIAAAAALVLGEGKQSFSRSQLLDAMKGAKAHYKATYRSNLSNYINTLVKSQDLLDHGSDNFGLHDKKRTELAQKLGLAK
jgi:hypothetical protein